MILPDTSVWADHLRAEDSTLAALLDAGEILIHPFVIGEIALGHLKQRDLILGGLTKLPHAPRADDAEVLHLISSRGWMATGIGYVDACLLAAVSVTPNAWVWTNDRKLGAVASDLGLATSPPFPTQTLG